MDKPETTLNTMFDGLADAFRDFEHLAPVQQAIFAMAVWLIASLVPQVRVLSRHADAAADWQVVWFRASLLALGVSVAVRYFFDLSSWVIVLGWLALNISSTMNTIYIVRRSRESEVERLAREVEEARRLLAAMEPRRADDV